MGSSRSRSPPRREGKEKKEKKKSKEKDGKKEKDRDRHRDRKERDRDNERDRDKSVRERERARDRDRERDRHRDRWDRDGHRDRDRGGRERERGRERRRSASYSSSRSRSRSRSKSRSPCSPKERSSKRRKEVEAGGTRGTPPHSATGTTPPAAVLSEEERAAAEKKKREAEVSALDAEMELRRKRVEEWRMKKLQAEQAEQAAAAAAAAAEGAPADGGDADGGDGGKTTVKGWSLENEDDDDAPQGDEEVAGDGDGMDEDAGGGEGGAAGDAEEDGIDPLDAFMAGNTEQLKIEEEEDPLDAFMADQVLPQTAAADVDMDGGKPSPKPGTGALPSVAPGAAVRRKQRLGLKAYAMSGSSSDDADEEDEEDEDDAEWAKAVNAGKMSKGDKLGPVDHSTIDYISFRKNFYIESLELSKLSDEEVVAMRVEMDGIKVRGVDPPKPIKTFTQAGLSYKLLEVLKKSGFEKPLPIQSQSIPIIMSGLDCIGIAKTGSGKTLAFVLPMMRHIKDQPAIVQGDGPVGLIMAPTRELVQQISKEVKRFAKPMGMASVAVYGGSGVANQISELKRGAEVVCATPGRMIDLLITSGGKITNLRRITYLVLDEADRMFDMGFEPQIMRIVQNIRPDRQTVMFSATFPRQVEALAKKVLISPVEIQVGGRSVVNADIDQIVEIRPEADRFLRLLELLGEWYEKGKLLIFVHSQEKCDTLFRDLLKYGYPCLSLHGGKEQSDRECTITDFKNNVCNILVATSIAARGLDVKDLVLVLNYDVPNHHEDYVHRVGRTGRAGSKGTAITFIGPDEDKYAPDLVKAFKESGAPIPQDLADLAAEFNEKRRKGLVQAHGSGYGGSGFKFDNEEQDKVKQSRKDQAKEYGYIGGDASSDSDDGGEIRLVDGAKSQPENKGLATAAGGSDSVVAGAIISAEALAQMQAIGQAAAAAASKSGPATGAAPASTAGLTMPTSAASLPMPTPQPTLAPAILSGIASIPGVTITAAAHPTSSIPMVAGDNSVTAMAAAARAAALAAAYGAAGVSGAAAAAAAAAAKTAPSTHYEAELEINDFPQHARWKVTHKDSVAQLAETTGAAVTTRGVFVPPGKAPPEGERKLYLLIEGPTELVVKRAKQEIKRMIEETTEKVMRRDTGAAGKYSIM